MTPIPLTETQMAELFRLRSENAALKEQVATKPLHYSYEDVVIMQRDLTGRILDAENTIAQQADVIEQMRDALVATRDDLEIRMKLADDDSLNISNSVLDQMCDAIDLQPSPEILQARDERVAEACAKLCSTKGAIKYAGLTIGEQCASDLNSGEWRKYL